MREHEWSAPCLDDQMRTAAWDPNEAPQFSESLVRSVDQLASKLEPLEPAACHGETREWQVWLPVVRGPIEAFACHCVVLHGRQMTRYEDLERMWLADYSEPLDRRPLRVARTSATIHVSFPEELEAWVDLETREIAGLRAEREEASSLLNWLTRTTEEEVERLTMGGETYRARLSAEVPVRRRTGRIRRRILWSVVPGCALIDAELGTALARTTGGEDLIGIAPSHEVPPYCLCTFPPEDQIRDLAQLWMFEDLGDRLAAAIEWYPLDVSPPRPSVVPPDRTRAEVTAS